MKAENGGPGTVYLHRLPNPNIDPKKFAENRTLLVANNNLKVKDNQKEVESGYSDISNSSCVAWVIPSAYPPIANLSTLPSIIVLDNLIVMRDAQIAFVNPITHTSSISVKVQLMQGDRSGHLHIGFNQSLYIGDGKLPLDLSIYKGGEATLQGELRVAGVIVSVEGVLKNVENMIVTDGGEYKRNWPIIDDLAAKFSLHELKICEKVENV